MIDRLEKLGLVTRKDDPADRRRWRLFLTAESEQLMDRLGDCATDVFEDAFAGFSQAERGQLTDLLERLRSNLSDIILPEPKQAHG